MLNVKERKEELKEELKGTYCDNICDYDNGYIGDIVNEIADNNVDIYTSDLFEWAKFNYDVIEDANNELGTPSDIIAQIQQGQFLQISNEIYNNIDETLLLFIYDYIYNELEIEEITEEQQEEIESENYYYNYDKLEQIIDFVNDTLEKESEVL